MKLTRTETIKGMLDEYEAFADLVGSLTDDEWHATSRCAGWEVRDVAGHVIGLAEDVAAGVPGSRNADEEAASIRVKSPVDAARGLRDTLEQLRVLGAALDSDDAWASPSPAGMSIGDGVRVLWYDTFVHADDIRAATGKATADGDGLRASLSYLEHELSEREWGPARIVFSGRDESFGALLIGEQADQAPVHRVDAHDFVMAATGRLDPAALGIDEGVNIYAE
jgi:uncharacterized protein (TIGR03083 family)